MMLPKSKKGDLVLRVSVNTFTGEKDVDVVAIVDNIGKNGEPIFKTVEKRLEEIIGFPIPPRELMDWNSMFN